MKLSIFEKVKCPMCKKMPNDEVLMLDLDGKSGLNPFLKRIWLITLDKWLMEA